MSAWVAPAARRRRRRRPKARAALACPKRLPVSDRCSFHARACCLQLFSMQQPPTSPFILAAEEGGPPPEQLGGSSSASEAEKLKAGSSQAEDSQESVEEAPTEVSASEQTLPQEWFIGLVARPDQQQGSAPH